MGNLNEIFWTSVNLSRNIAEYRRCSRFLGWLPMHETRFWTSVPLNLFVDTSRQCIHFLNNNNKIHCLQARWAEHCKRHLSANIYYSIATGVVTAATYERTGTHFAELIQFLWKLISETPYFLLCSVYLRGNHIGGTWKMARKLFSNRCDRRAIVSIANANDSVVSELKLETTLAART